MELKKVFSTAGQFLNKNSPVILTGLGVTGLVSTAVLSGRSTLKAQELMGDYIFEKEREILKENPRQIENPKVQIVEQNNVDGITNIFYHPDWKEKIQVTWKCYIPPVIVGVTSIACIIGAHSVNNKRQAVLASMYALSESAFSEYKDEVKKRLKPKELSEINEAIAEKKLEEAPFDEDRVILTGKGKYLCFDSFSGRYFRSDIETIRRIINDINQDILKSDFMNLNDFYFSLGLEPVKYGDEMGWSIDEFLDPKFETKLTPKGEPCLVIDYTVIPKFI